MIRGVMQPLFDHYLTTILLLFDHCLRESLRDNSGSHSNGELIQEWRRRARKGEGAQPVFGKVEGVGRLRGGVGEASE